MPHPQLNGELYTTSLVDLLLQAAYPKFILTQAVLFGKEYCKILTKILWLLLWLRGERLISHNSGKSG
jgi:hypothetical protein